MVWGLKETNLPSPTQGFQNTPFNQAFQSGLKSYSDINKTALDPLKTYAQAMSQLTYSQLMGPQFASKLLGNENIFQSISDPQVREQVKRLFAASQGYGMGGQQTGPPSTGFSWLDKFRDWVHGRSAPSATQQTQAAPEQQTNQVQPAQQQYQQQPEQQAPAEQPGQPQQTQGTSGTPLIDPSSPGGIRYPEDPIKASALNDWYQSPEAKIEGIKNGYIKSPDDKELMDWYNKQLNNAAPQTQQPAEQQAQPQQQQPIQPQQIEPPKQETVSETIGRKRGVIEEEKKRGEIRATQQGGLEDDYQSALNAGPAVQGLISIVKDPRFQALRKYPGFQSLQLDGKATFGNPAEQKLIGDWQINARTALKDAINSFRGRVLDKEIGISDQMKVADSDNINVVIGKLPAIEQFRQLLQQRSLLASKIMENQHKGKAEALEIADKMVNGPAIKAKIKAELDAAQQVTIRDPDTGKKQTVSVTRARELGVKGV